MRACFYPSPSIKTGSKPVWLLIPHQLEVQQVRSHAATPGPGWPSGSTNCKILERIGAQACNIKAMPKYHSWLSSQLLNFQVATKDIVAKT
jgi:hypothetical protein